MQSKIKSVIDFDYLIYLISILKTLREKTQKKSMTSTNSKEEADVEMPNAYPKEEEADEISKETIDKIKEQTKRFTSQWKHYIANHLPKPNTNWPKPPYDDIDIDIKNDDNNDECDECLQSHKKIIKLEDENELLKKENKKLNISRDKLKLCIYGINELIKQGKPPNYEAVEMNSKKLVLNNDIINCSKQINNIKNHIDQYFRKYFITNTTPIWIDIQDHKNIESNFINDELLRERIITYLNSNYSDNKYDLIKNNPTILMTTSSIFI